MRAVALAGAVALAALAGCAEEPRPSPHQDPFREGAAAAGVDFAHRTGATETANIYQTSAGGCGVLDYDGDGFLDLFLVQGQHRPGAGGNRLYRNRGNGTFEDVTEKARVRGQGYGIACAVGDFDADGDPDLYVCNYGTNELYRNQGDGTFEEAAAAVGADVKGCSVGAVFADLDRDGWTDLYVARYVKLTATSPLVCPQNGVPTSCGPQVYAAEPGVFLKNQGGNRFVDRTKAAGLVNDGRAMSLVAADANGDGLLDLFVANDTTADSLFLARAGGRFRNTALEAGIAYGYAGAAEGSMGADFGDYNADGRLDLFVGVMQDRMNLLFANEGDGLFRLATQEAGLAEPTREVVTYGGGFLDYDNDGDLDLFQANGHVQNRIAEIEPRLTWKQPRQLFENTGDARFTDRTQAAGPAISDPAVGRGAAFGDLDNDGDVDILVNNLDGPPTLLWNQAERRGNHWLRVKLAGKKPNTSPEGAMVELTVDGKPRLRYLHTTYSYASANDPRVHFGLGRSTAVGPLTVHWPDGTRQQVQIPGVDRELVVQQH